jgi:prepilin-type N-terminal cleavage/methylation domain-containing protein
MGKNNGFSLIELIIVIAIISIGATIAVPQFRSYQYNTNLKEAARDIASDISLYRQRAVSENVQYRIIFNQTANDYIVAKESVLGAGDFFGNIIAIKKVAGGNSLITMVSVPSFSGGVAYVTFQPRGTSTAGNVQLKHARISTIYKITTTIMGRVHVDH